MDGDFVAFVEIVFQCAGTSAPLSRVVAISGLVVNKLCVVGDFHFVGGEEGAIIVFENTISCHTAAVTVESIIRSAVVNGFFVFPCFITIPGTGTIK